VSDQPRGLRSLFGDSLVYGISVAAAPLALVLATPVLARELGPSGYGIVDVLAALLALASIAAMAGLDSAAARTWFDESDGERRLAGLRTAVTLVFALSCVVGALLVAIGVAAAELTESRVGIAAVVAAFGLMPLANTQLVARLGFLLPRRRRAYLLAGLLQAAVAPAAAIALVVAGAGPWGYFVGLGVGASAALAYSLAESGLLRGRRLARDLVAPMLRYGLPLVPAAAAAWLVFAVDRALIVWFRGLEEAGYYGLASKVTAPMLLLVSAFGIAWPPFIFGQPPERRRALRARALTAVLAGASALFLLVVLFADQLVELLGGGSFDPAARAVPGIALGWLGWAAATVLQSEFAIERRTSVIAGATGVAAAANVLLNLVLIPTYGFVGAAWATASSFLLLAAIFWLWERRAVRLPYSFPRLAGVVAVTALGSAALLVESLALRALVAAVCVAALAWLAAGHRETPG
jgi:O-antigen/teichoic acid export membrane protein